MTMQLRREAPQASPAEILLALELLQADARRVLGDANSQAHYVGAFRGDYVDLLFRKVSRVLDLLGAGLNAARRRAVRERGESAGPTTLELAAATPLGPRGDSLCQIGLRRCATGSWETDFLALEYALAQDAEGVFATLNTFAREQLAPLVYQAA